MTDDGSLFLVLDQGGHSSRVLVFDGAGEQVAAAARDIGTRTPAADRVEHDASELVDSLRDGIAGCAEQLGDDVGRVRAAGLATQRSTIVCWDRQSGEPLSPVISWQDRRAAPDFARRIHGRVEEIRERTGLFPSPHHGASKLYWCLSELPVVTRACEKSRLLAGPLASYLLHALLAERPAVVDPANASRMLLWNRHTGDWDPELLARFGIPVEILPACVPTVHSFGTLAVGEHAVPLSVTSGDQSAALFAHGAPDEREVSVNIGTGAFLQRAVWLGGGDAEPRLLASVVPTKADGTCVEVLEGTVHGAAAALTAFATAESIPDLETRLPGWLATVADPPVYLNNVSGLGSPWWISDLPSAFVGAGDVARRAVAVVESIAFLIATNLEALGRVPPPLTCIAVSGGLARLDALCQMLADLAALPVARAPAVEATARGTAWLLSERGDWSADDSACTGFTPRENAGLHERYQRWRAAMPAVE